ncbi:MAG TPA: helix-turn-helix transcriptional regulator [Pseudonocardiaceae bacterium]
MQQQLVRELIRLRSRAGLDQRQIAKTLDLSQATVSRVERLGKLLSLPEVLAWAQACGASPEVVDRLTALTDAAWMQMQPLRDLLADSLQLQDRVRANEATARTLLYYSPTVIPGLLQTPGYAEHVLRLTNYTGQGDEAAALAGRWRRQEALADRARRFDFVIPEAVLRWSPAGPEVLAAQLDRLGMVAGQANVSVGVVMSGQEPVLPFHGFTIYADRGEEDPFVTVELIHTYVTASHPTDVALYQQVFNKLRAASVIGPDAIALIQRVASELRAQP